MCRGIEGLVILLLAAGRSGFEVEHFHNVAKFHMGSGRIADGLDDPGRPVVRPFFAPGLDRFQQPPLGYLAGA